MALFVVTNRAGSALAVPAPVSQTLTAGESVTVQAESSAMNNAAINTLVNRGLVSIVQKNDPNVSDQIEGATAAGLGEPFTGAASTTDATVTAAASYAVPDLSVVQIVAKVAAYRDDGTEAASYEIAGTFRRSGGTVTQIGTTTALVAHEDVVGWDAALTISGTNVDVEVTGEAAKNIRWQVRGLVHRAS